MKNAILVALFFTTLNAYAQDTKEWNLSLGAGVAMKKNLRVGNTYDRLDKKFIVAPIPFLQVGYGRFSLGAQGLTFNIFGNKLVNISASIKKEGDRYQGVGMIPRKDSFFTGVSARFFNVGLSVARDINGRSKSFITQVNYGKLFLLSETMFLRVNFGLDWFDDHYAEYYYGVRKHEATASRREYHIHNYIQPSVGVLPVYKLGEKSSLMGAVNFKFVPKDVRQSPTMNGDKIDVGGFFGYAYNF